MKPVPAQRQLGCAATLRGCVKEYLCSQCSARSICFSAVEALLRNDVSRSAEHAAARYAASACCVRRRTGQGDAERPRKWREVPRLPLEAGAERRELSRRALGYRAPQDHVNFASIAHAPSRPLISHRPPPPHPNFAPSMLSHAAPNAKFQ
jgi:hypothetical protein